MPRSIKLRISLALLAILAVAAGIFLIFPSHQTTAKPTGGITAPTDITVPAAITPVPVPTTVPAATPSPVAESTARPAPAVAVKHAGPSASQMLKPYLGLWKVHGSELVINSDYTGTLGGNIGPCLDNDTSEQPLMCWQVDHLKFTVSNGSITARVVSVTYVKWDRTPTPKGFDSSKPTYTGIQAGDTFSLTLKDGGNLLLTTYHGRLSAWNNDQDRNRNWCGQKIEKAIHDGIDHPECGA